MKKDGPPAGRPLLTYVEQVDPGMSGLSDLFFSLSDPTRLRMLFALLEGEMCVSDLARSAGVSESAVSHQLRLLRSRGLVVSRRAGRRVYVSVSPDVVQALLSLGLEHVRP
ncbi:winged helix-turn-helix transcriptional regulator [Candidatus Fermentibacterales bacterium]|nr:winged helix-turn-helix transcriptional regulator [Candidatus Fermentibacterales bacterium]